jgi:hypothetical protein
VASVWYCVSPRLQKEPRHKLPFVLNCVAATVFTVIWVGLLARTTWHHDSSQVYCDPITATCV